MKKKSTTRNQTANLEKKKQSFGGKKQSFDP